MHLFADQNEIPSRSRPTLFVQYHEVFNSSMHLYASCATGSPTLFLLFIIAVLPADGGRVFLMKDIPAARKGLLASTDLHNGTNNMEYKIIAFFSRSKKR